MTLELDILSAAQRGDAAAFGQLVRSYEGELKAYCYRMSGSIHDAEDLVQDSLLRAWKGLAGFEGRSSFRTWLYRVASSACLDALEHKKSRSLPSAQGTPAVPGQPIEPFLEPIWLEPYPDQLVVDSKLSPEARYSARESIELAFMTALQRLSPKQRAVLILRDVLGWDAASCAELLDTTPTAINSSLIRAREAMSDATTQPVAPAETTRSLLTRYVQAWEQSNVSELVSLLRDDAILSMPPFAAWFVGPAAIGASVRGMVLPDGSAGSFKLVPTFANNSNAFMAYRKSETGRFEASGIHVLQVVDGQIAALHAFLDPSLAKPFGFAPTL